MASIEAAHAANRQGCLPGFLRRPAQWLSDQALGATQNDFLSKLLTVTANSAERPAGVQHDPFTAYLMELPHVQSRFSLLERESLHGMEARIIHLDGQTIDDMQMLDPRMIHVSDSENAILNGSSILSRASIRGDVAVIPGLFEQLRDLIPSQQQIMFASMKEQFDRENPTFEMIQANAATYIALFKAMIQGGMSYDEIVSFIGSSTGMVVCLAQEQVETRCVNVSVSDCEINGPYASIFTSLSLKGHSWGILPLIIQRS
ncbi:MAG: hypothetical protein WC489_04525 [Patescibacteria group bacterium]